MMSKCCKKCVKHLEKKGTSLNIAKDDFFIVQYNFSADGMLVPEDFTLAVVVEFSLVKLGEEEIGERMRLWGRIGFDGGDAWIWNILRDEEQRRRAVRACGRLNGKYAGVFTVTDDGEIHYECSLIVNEKNCAERMENTLNSMTALLSMEFRTIKKAIDGGSGEDSSGEETDAGALLSSMLGEMLAAGWGGSDDGEDEDDGEAAAQESAGGE
ncbi:MAG: hypothetical protein J5556_06245, partial [Deltaproteobacteria bacterium]|nr:hypothetical protein [Deltaproteobacteria bacterium]